MNSSGRTPPLDIRECSAEERNSFWIVFFNVLLKENADAVCSSVTRRKQFVHPGAQQTLLQVPVWCH